jgi:biotin transport system ATP-binding protein
MPAVLEGVSLVRDGSRILDRVDLALCERRIAVLGPNGSGKSTLVKLLNALVVPSTGRVTVGGLDTAHEAAAVRRRVGFVFQNPENQIVFPIVAEDLACGLKPLKLPKAEVRRRVADALARFGIGHLAERQAHTLSGGEKQLVALASVMVMRPSLVVFDEPTTLLDLRNRNRIREAIAGLPESAIVVTHDLELAADCERALVIDGGRVVRDGPPAPVIDSSVVLRSTGVGLTAVGSSSRSRARSMSADVTGSVVSWAIVCHRHRACGVSTRAGHLSVIGLRVGP